MNGNKTYQNQLNFHGLLIKDSLNKNGKCRVSNSLLYLKSFSEGSITVETAVIITIVITIIFIIIYGCILAFHQSLLKSTASKAAQLGALAWVDSRMDIETGKIDYGKERDPIYSSILYNNSFNYYEVLEDNSVVLESNPLNSFYKNRIDSIRKVVLDGISKSILKPVSTKLEVFYDNTFVYRKIRVCITHNMRVPLGFLKKFLNGNDFLMMTADSSAFISEPTEYIRNIDLAVECFYRIKDYTNIIDKVNEIKEKLETLTNFK